MKITVEHEISPQSIADLFVTAIENGRSRSWCDGVYLTKLREHADDSLAMETTPPNITCAVLNEVLGDDRRQAPWYSREKLWARDDWAIAVHELADEEEEEEGAKLNEYTGNWVRVHTVDSAKLAAGFVVFAHDQPTDFNDFLQENEDAVTADLWLQCVALGEVIYG